MTQLERRRQAQARYKLTEKGRAARARYERSEPRQRYLRSEGRKVAEARRLARHWEERSRLAREESICVECGREAELWGTLRCSPCNEKRTRWQGRHRGLARVTQLETQLEELLET